MSYDSLCEEYTEMSDFCNLSLYLWPPFLFIVWKIKFRHSDKLLLICYKETKRPTGFEKDEGE